MRFLFGCLLLFAVALHTLGQTAPLRFRFDRASFISQHDLVFQRHGRNWQLGIPMGNGDVGVLQWGTPDEVFYGINKADVWDRRFDKQQEVLVDIRTLEMLLNRAPNTLKSLLEESYKAPASKPYPTPKRCGALVIRTPGAREYSSYLDRLRLHSAIVDSEYRTRVDRREVRSFVYKDENLLVVRLSYDGPEAIAREIELLRPPDTTKARSGIADAEAFVDGKDFGIEQHFPAHWRFPEDFHYVMRGRVLGATYEPRAKGHRAVVELPASARGELLILVAVVSSRDDPDPKRATRDMLDRTAAWGFDRIEKKHRQMWDDYWRAAMIQIPDPVLEQNWYFQMYQMACISRPGKYLVGHCGLWNWGDFAPWNGDYHTDQNVQQIFWGTYSSNHPELALPFCDMFYKMLPLAQEQARDLFFVRGARYSLATHEYNGNMAGHPYFNELSNGPWIANLFWWYYDYTRDLEFLRSKGYPVMREITRFFADFMKQDENGVYHVYPSVPMEQSVFAKNPLTDISSVIRLLETTIQGSELLGVDSEERNKWKDMLSHMSSLPQAEGVFVMAEGFQPRQRTAHALLMNPVFPAEIVGLDRRGQWFESALRTLESQWRPYPDDSRVNYLQHFSHTRAWYIVAAARLGLAARAAEFARLFTSQFVKENGLTTTHDSWHSLSSIIDVSGIYVLAVNEMLLQSYSGVIRVFPAVPAGWDARFHQLRAAGAHLVSSEKRNGEVAYIAIQSLKGTRCRVYNPWKGDKVIVRDASRGSTLLETGGEFLEFNTRPDRTYMVERAAEPSVSFLEVVLGAKKTPGPRMIAEGRYFGRRPHAGGRPIGDTEKGRIINLAAMADGELLNVNAAHYDKPSATCSDFIGNRPYTAWFGLEFDTPREIREVKAFPAELGAIFYSSPALENLARDYVLEYWDGAAWREIPGTRVTNNDAFPVIQTFAPLSTTRIRIVVTRVDQDAKRTGKYRACMQELEVN